MSEPKFPPSALLPTITSAYEPVEHYLDYLAAPTGYSLVPPAVALRPIDAVLIHFLATYQPGRARVVDLATAATYGASTVLSRTLPQVQTVYVPCGSADGRQFVLARYFRDLQKPLAELAETDDLESVRVSRDAHAPLIVLAALVDGAGEGVADSVRRWLEPNPGAIALVLGVGPTGTCQGLLALSARFTSGPYQLALLRELAPALASSSLAVVGHRGQKVFAEALFRLGRLFTDHFCYLDLVKQACPFRPAAEPSGKPAASGGQMQQGTVGPAEQPGGSPGRTDFAVTCGSWRRRVRPSGAG